MNYFKDITAIVTVFGDSMQPMIAEGDELLCCNWSMDNLSTDDIYVVHVKDRTPMVKFISYTGGNEVTLISKNPLHKPFVIQKDDILKIHKVVKIVKA